MSAAPQKTILVPGLRAPISEQQAAQSFAAIIARISVQELAQAANRDIETARFWKAGRRCPNGASLINMCRTLPEVRAWIIAQVGGWL